MSGETVDHLPASFGPFGPKFEKKVSKGVVGILGPLCIGGGGLTTFLNFFRKGRTWAIVVSRGSYKSLFLPNFGLEKLGNSVLNFGLRNGLNRLGPSSLAL